MPTVTMRQTQKIWILRIFIIPLRKHQQTFKILVLIVNWINMMTLKSVKTLRHRIVEYRIWGMIVRMLGSLGSRIITRRIIKMRWDFFIFYVVSLKFSPHFLHTWMYTSWKLFWRQPYFLYSQNVIVYSILKNVDFYNFSWELYINIDFSGFFSMNIVYTL